MEAASSSAAAAPVATPRPPLPLLRTLTGLPQVTEGEAGDDVSVFEAEGKVVRVRTDDAGAERLRASLKQTRRILEVHGGPGVQFQELISARSRMKLTFRFSVEDISRVSGDVLFRLVSAVQKVVFAAVRSGSHADVSAATAFLFVHSHHPIVDERFAPFRRLSEFSTFFSSRFASAEGEEEAGAGASQDSASGGEALRPPAPRRPRRPTYRARFFVVFPMVVTTPGSALLYLTSACTYLSTHMAPAHDAAVMRAMGDDRCDWWGALDVVGIDDKVKRAMRAVGGSKASGKEVEALQAALEKTEDSWVPVGASAVITECAYCKKYQQHAPKMGQHSSRVPMYCKACDNTHLYDLGFRTRLLAVHCLSVRERGRGGGGSQQGPSPRASPSPSPVSRKRPFSSMSADETRAGGARSGRIRLVVPEQVIEDSECMLLTCGGVAAPASSGGAASPMSQRTCATDVGDAAPMVDVGGGGGSGAVLREVRIMQHAMTVHSSRGRIAPPGAVAEINAHFRRRFPEFSGCSVVAFRLASAACFSTLLRNGQCREVVVEAVLSGPGMYHCFEEGASTLPTATSPCCKVGLGSTRMFVFHKAPKNIRKNTDIVDVSFTGVVAALKTAFIYMAFHRPEDVDLKKDGVSDAVREYYTSHKLVPSKYPF